MQIDIRRKYTRALLEEENLNFLRIQRIPLYQRISSLYQSNQWHQPICYFYDDPLCGFYKIIVCSDRILENIMRNRAVCNKIIEMCRRTSVDYYHPNPSNYAYRLPTCSQVSVCPNHRVNDTLRRPFLRLSLFFCESVGIAVRGVRTGQRGHWDTSLGKTHKRLFI